jgi:putative hemolysin
MGFVVDEHGAIEGVVTATDILGAIVGASAYAPDDRGAEPARRSDGSWLIDGMTSVDDLRTMIGLRFDADEEESEYATAAGLVVQTLRRLPEPGDTVTIADWKFEVVDLDGRRIDKIIATRLPDKNANADI